MGKIILVTEGKPELEDFDKGFYSDDHNVPAVWIGKQIIAIGSGYETWPGGKDEEHLRWKLGPDKIYRVTIEELDKEKDRDNNG